MGTSFAVEPDTTAKGRVGSPTAISAASALDNPIFVRDGGTDRFWARELFAQRIIEVAKQPKSRSKDPRTWPAPLFPKSKEQMVRAVYHWAVVGQDGEGGVLALADVRDDSVAHVQGKPVPQFKAIVYYRSVDDPVVLRRLDRSERPTLYAYTAFGDDFVVGTDDGGYFLDIQDGRFWVSRFDLETETAQRLGALPAEFAVVDIAISELDEQRGLGPWLNYRMVRALQSTRTISGLLWDGQTLYALAKSQRYANRETDWWLLELDRETANVEQRFRLPLTASRVKALPGPDWAFLEVGPAQFFKASNKTLSGIKARVMVPGAWISQGSPLAPFDLSVECEAPGPRRFAVIPLHRNQGWRPTAPETQFGTKLWFWLVSFCLVGALPPASAQVLVGLPLPAQESTDCPTDSSFRRLVVQTDRGTDYALLSTDCGVRRSDRAGDWLLPDVELVELAALSGREAWALAGDPRQKAKGLYRIEDGARVIQEDHDFGGPVLGMVGSGHWHSTEQPSPLFVHTAESAWALQAGSRSWMELWSRDQVETLEPFSAHILRIEFLVAHHEMVVTGVRLEPTSDAAVGAEGWLISPENRPTYFVEREPRFEFLDKPWLVEMGHGRLGLVGVTSSSGWEVFSIPDDPTAQPEYLADGPGTFVSSVEYFEERLWVASDKGLAYRTLPKAKSREPRLVYGEPVKAVGVLGEVVYFFSGNGRDQICWVRFENLPWGRQPAPPECMRASFINEAYDPLDVVLHRDEAWILEETGLYYFDVEGKIDLELNAISGRLLGRLEILLWPSLSPNDASYSVRSHHVPDLELNDLCIAMRERSGAIEATPCDRNPQDSKPAENPKVAQRSTGKKAADQKSGATFGKENLRDRSGDPTESNEDRLTLPLGFSEVRTTARDPAGNISSDDRLILAIPPETWLAVVVSGLAPGLLGLVVLFLALAFRFWIVVLMSPVIRNPLFSWMNTIALMVPWLRRRLLRYYVSNLAKSIHGWEGEPCTNSHELLDKRFTLVLADPSRDGDQARGLVQALVHRGEAQETPCVPVVLNLETGRESLSITDRIAEDFAEYGGLSDRELVEFLIRRRGFHYCILLSADNRHREDLQHFLMQQHVGNHCVVILYPPNAPTIEASENDEAENDEAENDEAENDEAENDEAENDEAENDEAENDEAENDKAENDEAENDKAENDKAENDKAEKDKAEKDKAEKDKAEKDKAEKDKAEKEQGRERQGRERQGRERQGRERQGRERQGRERQGRERQAELVGPESA